MRKSFAEAQTDCQTQGMELLSVRSQEEQDWVKATYPNTGDYEFIWLGARESTGAWTWLGKQHRALHNVTHTRASLLR